MAYTPIRGYNYITGGGGMVFSMPLVKKILKNCKCPTPDAPDDMIIGACITNLKIPIIHSPTFHQVINYILTIWWPVIAPTTLHIIDCDWKKQTFQ